MIGVVNSYLDKYVEKFINERELGYFSIKQKVFLFRELAYLIEGGVAIADSVIVIKNGSDKGSIRKIADEMYSALNEGETLSFSMAQLPMYFSPGDVNIIRSGEESGELTHVLKYLSEEYEFLAKIKSKYVSAMIYPVTLFVVAILAVLLLFTKILPGIFKMVDSFGDIEIPAVTQFMMNMTDFMSGNVGGIIIGGTFIGFAVGVFFSTREGQELKDKYIFHLPLLGNVTRYYDMVKFMRYMRLLMEAGMNFLEVFIFLKDIMGNLSYKAMIDDIIGAINRGETIGGTLEKYTDFIAKDVVALLKVGEETASFESALSNAIVMYEDEFQKVLDGLSKVIEPVLIVFIGGVICMVAMSVFGIIGSLLDSMG